MSKTADIKKQVRLDADVHQELVEIKRNALSPLTIGFLANHAIRNGLEETRSLFNLIRKTPKRK